jgi:hypothetical protein
MEKKFRTIKGMVISQVTTRSIADPQELELVEYNVYTADEWNMGRGFRTPEFEGCSLAEAISQAENY